MLKTQRGRNMEAVDTVAVDDAVLGKVRRAIKAALSYEDAV